jgi:galactonate dehydratase
VKITQLTTFVVGNPWKNWVFVRVDTDDGIHGVGEASLNGFARTAQVAVEELSEHCVGLDASQVEVLRRRLVRDVYSDGGQLHMAAVAAIEIACWDILGKACGRPVFDLLGGRVRDSTRVYANGWYRHDRTPEAFAQSAREVVARGYTALKFDPFGVAHLQTSRRDEDLAVAIVESVRHAVGPDIDLMIEAHARFNVATAVRIADRIAPFHPAWFEEPVEHRYTSGTVEVARRSPVPVASGEGLTSLQHFAELLRHDVVSIVQPDPLYVGGLWTTRAVATLAEAHDAVIAPHSAQGPICGAACLQIAGCTPNFYIQESFDEFNEGWTHEIVQPAPVPVAGHLPIPDAPGLGVEVDWERLHAFPYRRGNTIRLFEHDWWLRRPAAEAAESASAA